MAKRLTKALTLLNSWKILDVVADKYLDFRLIYKLAQIQDNSTTVPEITACIVNELSFLTQPVNDDGDTLLHLLFQTNNMPLIHALQELPTDQWQQLSTTRNPINNESLFQVIASLGLVQYYKLLHHVPQSQAEWESALIISILNERTSFVQKLLRDGLNPNTRWRDYCVLMLAAKSGQEKMCELLLNAGANPTLRNAQRQTADMLWPASVSPNPFEQLQQNLLQLAQNVHAERTRLLSRIIAQPYLLTWHLNIKGDTFLHMAFSANNVFVIESLSRHTQWQALSCTVNPQYQITLLHVIAHKGYSHLLPFLNLEKIDINAQNIDQQSALHLAAQWGHDKFCKILLHLKANTQLKDNKNRTAEDIWLTKHSTEPNPFYCRNQHLELTKSKFIQLLKTHLGAAHTFLSFFTAPDPALLELETVIQKCNFKRYDNRTAKELINNTLESWIDRCEPKASLRQTVLTIQRELGLESHQTLRY
jgi:ankyrin repeat protein